jgi:charged multivesicular body protein 1
MRQVSQSMGNVVKGMDSAMKAMDLEKVCNMILSCLCWLCGLVMWASYVDTEYGMLTGVTKQISAIMDKFETQFEDLDVATGYYENATSSATAVGTPQEDVDRLMSQVADEAGVELNQDLEAATPAKTKVGPTEQEEEGLGERLRALRA